MFHVLGYQIQTAECETQMQRSGYGAASYRVLAQEGNYNAVLIQDICNRMCAWCIIVLAHWTSFWQDWLAQLTKNAPAARTGVRVSPPNAITRPEKNKTRKALLTTNTDQLKQIYHGAVAAHSAGLNIHTCVALRNEHIFRLRSVQRNKRALSRCRHAVLRPKEGPARHICSGKRRSLVTVNPAVLSPCCSA
jgi:hypothetical protein